MPSLGRLVVSLAFTGVALASPFPGGVTANIAPKASAPASCAKSIPGLYGIAIERLDNRPPMGGITDSIKLDGVHVPLVARGHPAMPVSQIGDGQVQGSTGTATLPDVSLCHGAEGPIPCPATYPIGPACPGENGCGYSYPTPPLVHGGSGSGSCNGSSCYVSPASQISDGQVQGPTGIAPLSSYGHGCNGGKSCPGGDNGSTGYGYDGYSCEGKDTCVPAVGPVSQIGDGQVQAPTYGPPPPTMTTPYTTVTITSVQTHTSMSTAPIVTQISDHQPQVPHAPSIITHTAKQTHTYTTVKPATSTHYERRSEASIPDDLSLGTGCSSDSALRMVLQDGVLKDFHGRTGYIASNRQFQFDEPAQAGAIYTAGFSVCDDGALALGDSTQFWQCRSGDFSNLYDQSIGAQCEPIQIKLIYLLHC